MAVNSGEQSDIQNIRHKAEQAKAQLQQLSATLTSRDGAATVTVNASGALQQLSFGPRAQGIPLNQLAASVLATAQRAQAQAARQIAAVMAPVIGTDSDAMKFLEEQLPAPEVPDEQPPPEPPQFVFNDEQATPPVWPPVPPQPGRPAPPAQPRPPRPARPPVEDDGDDDFGSVLQRGW
ncbi:MAG TPA: YbaB/EbfC family nucleoid-associated protein [Amycolatopsis sp.]|uniref:YbaB/EbfC family nucleoid-associated protein n=1 Tax=Amycolatopsis sp. TaxID=37632 RepID=UPI002B499706|nr:YbaB/EbfC family nucleoid-associated protein [Amycolatopsis sp.]HKS45110.1 YbaB/EbfC family nucleoid-associated protein [Amycolatopsis sp.]